MLPQSIGTHNESCVIVRVCVGVCVDRRRQGRNEGESVMKATGERAGVSECVSGPTTRQWFSVMSRSKRAPVAKPELLRRWYPATCEWGELVMQVPEPGVVYAQGERKPLPKPPQTVSVFRIGSVFIASVGRVRVAGACPLRALADACEWSRVFG